MRAWHVSIVASPAKYTPVRSLRPIVRPHTPAARESHRDSAVDSGLMHEYSFLVGSLCDHSALSRAIYCAEQQNVHPHDVLLSEGIVTRGAYVATVARYLGIPFLQPGQIPTGAITLIDGTKHAPLH